jgi:hypothetical protein
MAHAFAQRDLFKRQKIIYMLTLKEYTCVHDVKYIRAIKISLLQ